MSNPLHSGHCFCGDVKFAVTGPEKYACFCHCESCRRAAGGTSVPCVVIHDGLPQYEKNAGQATATGFPTTSRLMMQRRKTAS